MLENKLSQFEEERALLASQANSDIGELRALQTKANTLAAERDTARRKLGESEKEAQLLADQNTSNENEILQLKIALDNAIGVIDELEERIKAFEQEDLNAFFTRTGRRDNTKLQQETSHRQTKPFLGEKSQIIHQPSPPKKKEDQDETSPMRHHNTTPPLIPSQEHYPDVSTCKQSNPTVITACESTTSQVPHRQTTLEEAIEINPIHQRTTFPAGNAFLTVRQRRREQQARAATCVIPPRRVRGVYGERGLKGTDTHQLLITFEKLVEPSNGFLVPYDEEGEFDVEVVVSEEWVPYCRVDENSEPFQLWKMRKHQRSSSPEDAGREYEL